MQDQKYILVVDNDVDRRYQIETVLSFVGENFQVCSESQAESLLKDGINEFRKGSYLNKVKASQLFKKSVEYKISNNPALGYLVRSYGELIPNALDRERASRTLFNLINNLTIV